MDTKDTAVTGHDPEHHRGGGMLSLVDVQHLLDTISKETIVSGNTALIDSPILLV